MNKCPLPELDSTVLRLDMKDCPEFRYRLVIEKGVEARVSVSIDAHYQENEKNKFYKKHNDKSLYVVKKGWVAILVPDETGYTVNIGFARSSDFYVEAPGGKPYLVYLSVGAIWSYASSDSETSDVSKLKEEALPKEDEILLLYRKQRKLHENEVLNRIKKSYSFYTKSACIGQSTVVNTECSDAKF